MLKLRRTVRYLARGGIATWLSVLLGLYCFSWAALVLLEGVRFLSPIDHTLYFLATITPLGNVDAPSTLTVGGKMLTIVTTFLGIGIVVTVIGAIARECISFLTRERRGLIHSQRTKHIVVLVDQAETSSVVRLVREILADIHRLPRPIVIGSTNSENSAVLDDPKVAEATVEFRWAETLHEDDMFRRTNVAAADKIIVAGKTDSETVLTILALNGRNPEAHIVAVLKDRANERHILNIPRARSVECVVPLQDLMVVQEMQDPGLAGLLHDRLENGGDATFYRIPLPMGVTEGTLGHYLLPLWQRYGALLTAVVTKEGVVSNPLPTMPINDVTDVFVSAQARPQHINWSTLKAGE